MYGTNARRGLGDLSGLPPILSITPSPIPAGPGQQVLIVRTTGLRLGFTLGVVPDLNTVTNPTTQGYGGPLYAVSADGTIAKVLVDFRGNIGGWSARIINPSTYQTTDWFRIVTVPGLVPTFNVSDYFLQSAQMTPVLVTVTTQLRASRNAAGQPTNQVIVTGGEANVPQPGGGSRPQTFPGPGLLVSQDGGSWQFVPAAQAKALVEQYFGIDIPQCTGSAIGQDLTDPFGLPLVTPQCPGSLSWVDSQGNAVTSPWSTGAVPQPGSPTRTVRPSTPPTPAPAISLTPPALYQSPTTVGPSSTPVPPVRLAPPALYQSPPTVGPPSTPAPSVRLAPPNLYLSPPTVGPGFDVTPPSAPAPSGAAPSSGVSFGTLALFAAAGFGVYEVTRTRRR